MKNVYQIGSGELTFDIIEPETGTGVRSTGAHSEVQGLSG